METQVSQINHELITLRYRFQGTYRYKGWKCIHCRKRFATVYAGKGRCPCCPECKYETGAVCSKCGHVLV